MWGGGKIYAASAQRTTADMLSLFALLSLSAEYRERTLANSQGCNIRFCETIIFVYISKNI